MHLEIICTEVATKFRSYFQRAPYLIGICINLLEIIKKKLNNLEPTKTILIFLKWKKH